MKHCFWRSLMAICLLLTLVVSLTACGSGGYREVKSKRAWRKTVLTIDGEDVSFELLRFYFFRHTSELDGGDASLWSGDGAAELTKKALDLAVTDVCELYALFDVCRSYGIDPERDDIDALVNEYVTYDVDGGSPDGSTLVTGFGGDYDKYLESLRELHLTDTVNRLLYRYAACLKVLNAYIQNGAEGRATAADDELRDFLRSDDCVHANYAELQKVAYTRERAEELHAQMKAAEGNLTKLGELVTHHRPTAENPRSGEYYSRYATDATNAALYNLIFSLRPGEVSDLIEIGDSYYIYYGMEKDAQADDIRSLYLEEVFMYRKMAGKALVLRTKVEYKPAYEALTYAILSEEA